MKHYLLILTVLLFGITAISSCDSNDGIAPDPEYGWGKTMAGNDPEERTWPDLSENYWEYTFNLSKYAEGSVGLRFTGTYPTVDTRFFNITIYSDRTTEMLASIEDFNIDPESGSANPFSDAGVTGTNYFEVNAIPSTADGSKYKNPIEFPAGTERVTVLLRIYFNSLDHAHDFGGVALPEITYFDVNTGKDLGKAPRAKSLYYTRFMGVISRVPQIRPQPLLHFTLAPNMLYPNGPTGYVTSVNRMHVDSTLMFRFIPPTHPETIAGNRSANVRYWSICLGDTTTFTAATLTDKMALKDNNGHVNFLIVDPENSNFAAIKAKATQMKVNLMEWSVKSYGEPLMVFYRQMYIHENYGFSVKKITPYSQLDDNGQAVPISWEHLANLVLGEYGPLGRKENVSFFLDTNFKLEDIRPY